MAQGFIAAGNYVLNSFGISVECWRTLGGIERGQASAGTRAYVNQPSAAANRIGNSINGLRDLRQSALHGSGNFVIFLIDDAGNLQRGERIQAGGSTVLLLSPEITEFA